MNEAVWKKKEIMGGNFTQLQQLKECFCDFIYIYKDSDSVYIISQIYCNMS